MRNKAYEKWKHEMVLSAKEMGVPIVGHFELTPRCNLDCKMCYIHNANSNALRAKELPTETWKRIFDEAYDCGMLFANLTGGECLLRQDFKELYLHLWNKRVMIAVLTNGTLLNEDYLEFFREYPPAEVQISLYGSCEEGYLAVTGHHGFQRAVDAIKGLTEAHIPVHVAVTPSSYMKDDFINIRRFCKENSIWCSPSEFYLAKNRDDIDTDSSYLTIDEIVELSKEQALLNGPLIPIENPPVPGGSCKIAPKGLKCNAGSCLTMVSWDGTMHPCTMLPVGKTSLLDMSYAEAWQATRKVVSEMLFGAECVGCPYDKLCPRCPTYRLTGVDTGHCNPMICEVTQKLVAAGVKKVSEEKLETPK